VLGEELADLWRCRNVGYESLGVVNTRTIVNVKDKPGFFVVVDPAGNQHSSSPTGSGCR